uniref:Uncharacterized protein n=1 Tax=Anopheles maculatus TaxID=74869 RepID=A0A182TA70_9DIPT
MNEDDLSPKSGGAPDDELDKSSSTPSDFEVFEYEDIHEECTNAKSGKYPNGDSVHHYHRRLGTSASDEEDDACGTPLNLELAQLLTQGIVTKTKANFGISKNIETLERSTIELESSASSDQDHVSTESGSAGHRSALRTTSCCSTSYKRDPDLYLRRSDDNDLDSFDDSRQQQQQQQLHDEEDIDFVQLKNDQRQQQQAADPSGQFFEDDELVFESHTGCTPGSVCGSGFFRYTEPTTSYHSACGGYDSERMMFEGIVLSVCSSVIFREFVKFVLQYLLHSDSCFFGFINV